MRSLTDQALDLYTTLKEQLLHLREQHSDFIPHANAAMALCRQALRALKEAFDQHSFADAAEEIHFFKWTKPPFLAELIYYSKVYFLHVRWPAGSIRRQKKYLRKALNELNWFYESHNDFYTYYRTGATDRDASYFTYAPLAPALMPEDYGGHLDSFSTGCDMLMGKVLASGRWQDYLLDKQDSLRAGRSTQGLPPSLPWTGSKVAMVELVYALYHAMVIGGGKIPIKNIVSAFERLFNVDLVGFYDMFADIGKRQEHPARFLDELKAALLDKLNKAK